jgi:hypothetical protein
MPSREEEPALPPRPDTGAGSAGDVTAPPPPRPPTTPDRTVASAIVYAPIAVAWFAAFASAADGSFSIAARVLFALLALGAL